MWQVNTAQSSTVLHSYVLNRWTKFGTKIFAHFWAIVIFMFGYYLVHPVEDYITVFNFNKVIGFFCVHCVIVASDLWCCCKEAILCSLLKNSTMHPNALASYFPIFNIDMPLQRIRCIYCKFLLQYVCRLPDVASSGVQWHKVLIHTDKFIVVCNEGGEWMMWLLIYRSNGEWFLRQMNVHNNADVSCEPLW